MHHDDKNQFEAKLKEYQKGDSNINNRFETDNKLDDVRFLDQYREVQHYEV